MIDADYIRRAIHLAQTARGRVEPNPMVGCVIVKDGRVIGEGCHGQYGGPHAEPTALAACTESPVGATAYVTLEPCCHLNKQTPPCTPRLIEAKIARVVFGCLDPNPDVNGKGVGLLRAAGIVVDGPVLELATKQLIAPFIARTVDHRPYVTLKWAQTVDGCLAGPMGKRLKITDAPADRVVHELRSRCDAIAVGTHTVLNDDPLLTARDVTNPRPLLRIVLSNTLKMPLTSRLVTSAHENPLLVFTSEASAVIYRDTVKQLQKHGVEIIPLPDREGRFSFTDAARVLSERRVSHLLVESGPTLTRYFLASGQCDRAWVFRSKTVTTNNTGMAAPQLMYPAVATTDLGNDTLTEYLNPASDVTFTTAEPSADFKLASEKDRLPSSRGL